MTTYSFNVYRSHLGTTRTYVTHILYASPPSSLISRSLSEMAKSTRRRKMSSTTISQLRRLLASASLDTKRLLAYEPNVFDDKQLLRLLSSTFNDLEDRRNISLSAKQQLFRALLTCLSNSNPPLLNGRFLAWSEQNLPRFRRTARARPSPLLDLIPQQAAQGLTPDFSPAAALDHVHDQIENACRAEIEEYRQMLLDQHALLNSVKCNDISEDSSHDGYLENPRLRKAHRDALEQFVGCVENNEPLPDPPLNLLPALRKRYQLPSKNARPWLLAQYRLPNQTLHAIFILVALRTGWNPQSVASLTIDNLGGEPGGSLLLQSFKLKTDDKTPAVAISRKDKLAQDAIGLLRSNLYWAKKLKMVPANENRLWIGWSSKPDARQIVADGHLLRRFIDRHNLTPFRLKDLRSLRVSIAYVKHRDLDQVRLILGHQSFSSIDTYLRSTVIFKLNESNILRFQHLLEKELLSSNQPPPQTFSTGDGGHCRDSSKSRFAGGMTPCDGMGCHIGTTCENYTLRPTKESVADALRTLHSYRECWQALADQQPDRFWDIHLPRIVHIHVMLEAIRDLRPDLLPEGMWK